MKYYFRIMLTLLFLLSFNSALFAGNEMPVIGKAKVSAGAIVEVAFLVGDRAERYPATAFEDQELYIYKKVVRSDGSVFYLAEGHGFVHDCPEHGREVLDVPGVAVLIIIHPHLVDSGLVTIEIFGNI